MYNKFVEQAIKMEPRYITMIIPSRWMIGGKGLDEFRNYMLACNKISTMVDYVNSSDCFSGVDVNGGICYFLWEKHYSGKCNFVNVEDGNTNTSSRYLLNGNKDFIRFNKAVSIVEKIKNHPSFKPFSSIVSFRNPFNIPSNANLKFTNPNNLLDLTKIYGFNKGRYEKFLHQDVLIEKNIVLRDRWKIFIPKAVGDANMKKRGLFLKPIKGIINSVCTETYLAIGPFDTEKEVDFCIEYMKTKFFHFLFGMKRISQNTTKETYDFIPLLDFSKIYTDAELYTMFQFSDEEINYIENIFSNKEFVNE
ncbi:Eco57I restriction-modification methylase domain-containing protein [Malacoplasma penetrans]|uniref:Eco57I restriction-modification methylase domain-containing protein n=1 Tax=Malacoplasma penetrans TaxID=28227 RepID=UPI00197B22AE|nr:Eco57I restriction-modification methylase domain-containing protein [Malacoplasma penetrans]